jgi:hypothetical protein
VICPEPVDALVHLRSKEKSSLFFEEIDRKVKMLERVAIAETTFLTKLEWGGYLP